MIDAERAAWYAALEAAPDDFLLRAVFADWLDDRGEHDLAAGYRAIAMLRVQMGEKRIWRQVCGVNSFCETNVEWRATLQEVRSESKLHFVTPAWYDRVFETAGGQQGYRSRMKDNSCPTRTEWERIVAEEWSRLTPEQQREAVELLGAADPPQSVADSVAATA